ncbi:MAG: Dabb family protein [Planctomycetaceae bacterium]|nr:Dabb family protein [Planctomycetaceae bacterium]MBV8314752.1 Dabb family protein [Planctomycetaceae bacterium]MBV8383060.1 Dabb family protein [Planctomycetaceae bacterium]
MVFFTLKDHCPEVRQRRVASCPEHLSGHEGTVSFSVGTIDGEVVEPVSDRDFDLALHLLFENKAAIAAYQKRARHQRFIEEGKWRSGKEFLNRGGSSRWASGVRTRGGPAAGRCWRRRRGHSPWALPPWVAWPTQAMCPRPRPAR